MMQMKSSRDTGVPAPSFWRRSSKAAWKENALKRDAHKRKQEKYLKMMRCS